LLPVRLRFSLGSEAVLLFMCSSKLSSTCDKSPVLSSGGFLHFLLFL
jgi:hypothetical protein